MLFEARQPKNNINEKEQQQDTSFPGDERQATAA